MAGLRFGATILVLALETTGGFTLVLLYVPRLDGIGFLVFWLHTFFIFITVRFVGFRIPYRKTGNNLEVNAYPMDCILAAVMMVKAAPVLCMTHPSCMVFSSY